MPAAATPRSQAAAAPSSALAKAAEEASGRFRETARLATEKLDKLRAEGAAAPDLPKEATEVICTLQWLTCMLVNTAEEALKAKTSLLRANEQVATDQLERAHSAVLNATSAMEAAQLERDAAHKELQALGQRIRKDGLAARQRQAKDAARVQALTEQASQLQANLRLSEAAWVEERRAEQAAGAQRERNFQSVIVKLQQELDASSTASGTPAVPKKEEGKPADDPDLRTRVSQLQLQCAGFSTYP